MNIQTVATNLRVTIAGKEKLMSEWSNADMVTTADRIHRAGIVGMLELNINELKRILQDIEQCEPSLPGEGYNYEKWDGDE